MTTLDTVQETDRNIMSLKTTARRALCAGALLSAASFNLAGAVSFAVCGVMVGYFWYLAMRFVFKRAGLFSGNADDGTEPAPRGKPYRWVVWAGQMTLSGIATACLLNLISPFIPAGDWHWLLRSLFIILVWPALMWSLRPWMRRHLPA